MAIMQRNEGSGCWKNLAERPKRARGERPWAYGRCRTSHWDASLLQRCHSRQEQSEPHALPECPAASASRKPEGAKSLREIKQKYSKWANASWCDHGTDVHWTVSPAWWRLHKCITVTILQTWLAYLRPGHRVLDWGSGCGYKLDWGHRFFGINGIGVELLHASVAWARDNVACRNCLADGRDLSWLPNNSFNAVISFAALYHLHGHEQCDVVGQLVEKLRPGGRAWLGWMAPYAWYTDIYGKDNILASEYPQKCPDGGSPAPGWEAICAEGERHMIPPQATWDACFMRLRRGRWAKHGINATFHWKREVDVFVDPRDRAAVRRRDPEQLPGYSLFIQRSRREHRASARKLTSTGGAGTRATASKLNSIRTLFPENQIRRKTRNWILNHGIQAGLSAPGSIALSMSAHNFYLYDQGESELRRAVRGMLRQPWPELRKVLQAKLLAVEFVLADRLRGLGMAPADDPHECALPVLRNFLEYQVIRHSFDDSNRPPRSHLLDMGERRVKLGIKSLWRQVLDSSKAWTASVGSLGFCDCAKDAVEQITAGVDKLGMNRDGFAATFDNPDSFEITAARSMAGCEEQWSLGSWEDNDEQWEVSFPFYIRPFTDPDPSSRYRCSINAASFISVCSQHYLANGQVHAAKRALELAAFLTVLGGDCMGEGSPPPPVRSVDIFYNNARAQRYASKVAMGVLPPSVMAWRHSPLNETMDNASFSPDLDDSVPRNFAGGNKDASVAQAASGSWLCDLSSCKERTPRFLRGAMQHRPTAAANTLKVESKKRLGALVASEKLSQRSECHPLSEDTQRFLEQRIEALVGQSAGQKTCEPRRAHYISSWGSEVVQVIAPPDVQWSVTTLVPIPWSVMETLHPSTQDAIMNRYPKVHIKGTGSSAFNITKDVSVKLTQDIKVHGLEFQIAGLDKTRCTKHVEIHSRAHRLPYSILQPRMARRSGLEKNMFSFAIVVLDSTIAHAWDIFCPKVLAEMAKYERPGKPSSHEVFRFHGHHALLDPECDCLTQDNMVSLFSGRRVPRQLASKRRVRTTPAVSLELESELEKFRFLWQEMQEAGYVTLSADDSCSRSPLNVCDPEYDFFDTYAPTFAIDESACTHEVFCRHQEVFDYAAQWIDIHSDMPRLAYLHLDGTHGTRPESLVHYDEEIAEWVRSLLQGRDGENTIVILMSDHGVQSGDGHLTSQPFFLAWLPDSLLDLVGEDGRQALRTNTKRLTTPYDVHFTLQQILHLSLADARGLQVSSLAATRAPLEKTTTPGHVVRNLFFPIPEGRSCDDAGLPSARCYCKGNTIPWEGFGGSRNDLRDLAQQLVDILNRNARSNIMHNPLDMSICRLQSLRFVEGVRSKSDGSTIEIIITTEPFGLLWKGIAYWKGADDVVGRWMYRQELDVENVGYVMSGVEQITRYFPHEHCTPSGMDPKFCVCNPNVIHRLKDHERFWHDWPSLPLQ